LDDLKRANAQAANDKVVLFIRLARLVLDESIAPEALRAAILAEIPAKRLAAAVDEAEPLARPPDDNYFDLLAHRWDCPAIFGAPHVMGESKLTALAHGVCGAGCAF
jgi:hypothetical protein